MKHSGETRRGDYINGVRWREDIRLRHNDIPSGGINFGVEIQNLASVVRVKRLSAGRS
jgi:hypothetical protein